MKISRFHYGRSQSGRDVSATTIENSYLTVTVLDYGLRLTKLCLKSSEDTTRSLVLGGWPLSVYEQDTASHGAIVGRTCNRIREGHLELNGKTFQLDLNHGKHHLHGGYSGLHNQHWAVREHDQGIAAQAELEDGESGYPGNVRINVELTLDGDTLCYQYQAISDDDTLLDITNHAYFCLDDSGTIVDHELRIPSRHYAPMDHEMIPTGQLRDVTNTPFDFSKATAVGDRIDDSDDQLGLAAGYDHSWLLDEDATVTLYSPSSKIELNVTTSSPAIQVYTGNHLEQPRSAICLETQHLPDACHHESFTTPYLAAGQPFNAWSRYQFRIRDGAGVN